MAAAIPKTARATTARAKSTPARAKLAGAARSGIVTFAGVMFFIVGLFNIIDGLVAALNSGYFNDSTLFASVEAWGWVILGTGIVQLLIGAAILHRRVGGLVGGLVLAVWAAILQLAFLAVFPAWSLIVLFILGAIIYALTVHADEFA